MNERSRPGTWCSGITPAWHVGGPGFNPQCVHFRVGICQLVFCNWKWQCRHFDKYATHSEPAGNVRTAGALGDAAAGVVLFPKCANVNVDSNPGNAECTGATCD